MISNYQNRYRMALKKKVDYMKLQFEKSMSARCYKEPHQAINEKYINIDMHVKNLTDNISKKIIISKKDFTRSSYKIRCTKSAKDTIKRI